MRVNAGPVLKIEYSGKHEPHILRILARQKPAGITLDGNTLPEGPAWKFDTNEQRLIVKTANYTNGTYRITWP